MFSGIIEETACIIALDRNEPVRLTLESSLDQSDTKIGDSIAVNGACLTVVEKKSNILSFELAQETVRRTTLGTLKNGDKVNIERSLRVGERIHGHFVFGHVDATIELKQTKNDGAAVKMVWELPSELRPFIVTKGSVSISGISLTVGETDAESFSVYVIPHTLDVTVLGKINPGQRANLEVDMLARYVNSSVGGAK